MEMITISAKTLDEAITKALIELHTTSDHLYYEIVQKESAGIFGLFGSKPCVIRAKVMTEAEEKAVKKAAAEKVIAEKAANTVLEEQKKAEAEITEKKAEAPVKKEAKAEKNPEENKPFDKKNSDRKKPERRENGRREKMNKKNDSYVEKVDDSDKKQVKEEKVKQPVKADPEKVQKAAKEFLISMFGAMGMEVSVETSVKLEEGELQVMMNGEDMGILIGKRGQTLDSIQYLVSLVVNKETEGYLRVKLDTENYRERRKDTLETLARNISYKVKRTKRPVSLEPMNPYERRIIHSALQNDRYVVTRSEGEDPYRHVVISLKNERYSNGGRKERYYRKDREKAVEKQAEKPVEAAAENQKTSEE